MNNYVIEKQTIEKAVDWWVGKITGNEPHDNGDKSFTSFVTCALADSGRGKITSKQIDIFKEYLSEYIANRYKEFGRVGLDCDYGPGLGLRESADEAEIKYLNFPFKTSMSISDNNVEVQDGYGQPWEKI